MKEDNLEPEQIEAIRNAFDYAIKNGPWEESNFLRTMGKRLEKIREEFLVEAGVKSPSGLNANEDLDDASPRSGQKEIFISLYSSNGGQLSAWEKLIVNLPRQLISRPIYADEESIQNRIKSKSIPVNEAYVCAYICKGDIKTIAEDKIPHDKLNNPLLTVKDRAISLDDITRFVHMSGTYSYIEGRLVKNDDVSSNEQNKSD